MRKISMLIATGVLAVSLTACGSTQREDVVPLDDGKPVPECVTINFYTSADWDGEKSNQRANVYCLREEQENMKGSN